MKKRNEISGRNDSLSTAESRKYKKNSKNNNTDYDEMKPPFVSNFLIA